MKKVSTAIIILVGLIVFVILGVLATKVGGISIRNNLAQTDEIIFNISQPVLRGVLTTVRWNVVEDESIKNIAVMFRGSTDEVIIGKVNFSDGQAQVVFPCDSKSTKGSVILKDAKTDKVIASQVIELLSPGRECAK